VNGALGTKIGVKFHIRSMAGEIVIVSLRRQSRIR
jgi:hypothetical protein